MSVERKTAADFLASAADGRLWSQAKRLRALPRAYIAITSPFSMAIGGKVFLPTEQRLTGWDYEKVQRLIARLQLDYLPVFQYASDSQFLDWLFRMYELSTKGLRSGTKRKRNTDEPSDPTDKP